MLKNWEKKDKGALMPIEFRSTKGKVIYFINLILLIMVAMVCLLPVLWLVITSFKSVKEMYQTPVTLFPAHFDLSKVARVWKKVNLMRYYGNSIMLCAGDMLFDIVICGLAGYVMSRLRPKGVKAVQLAVFYTMLVPTTISMVPLFKTFLDMPIIHTSLVDTYVPMWMMAGSNTFNILLFKSFFDSISKEYIEAAQIDGCSGLGIFIKVVLPLSLPIVMVVAILDFTGGWGDFLYPYLLLQEKTLYPVAVKIYELKTNSGGILVDEYMMTLFFSTIPPIIIFLFFQKQMMNGVSFSGVKG